MEHISPKTHSPDSITTHIERPTTANLLAYTSFLSVYSSSIREVLIAWPDRIAKGVNAMAKAPEQSIDPRIVGIVMLVIAVLAPYVFSVYSNIYDETIVEMTAGLWHLNTLDELPIIVIGPLITLAAAPFLILRLLFVHQVYECYQGKVSRRRAIVVGLASELQIVVILIVAYVTALSGVPIPYIPIAAPIPMLLMVGLVFLYFYPSLGTARIWEEVESEGQSVGQ